MDLQAPVITSTFVDEAGADALMARLQLRRSLVDKAQAVYDAAIVETLRWNSWQAEDWNKIDAIAHASNLLYNYLWGEEFETLAGRITELERGRERLHIIRHFNLRRPFA